MGSRGDPELEQLKKEYLGYVKQLSAWFKSGVPPDGVPRKALEAYLKIAEKAIREGIDRAGQQAKRAEMIRKWLEEHK